MFVMTIDQRRSRDRPDGVPELLEALAGVPAARPFERTAGDAADPRLVAGRGELRRALHLTVARR